MNRWAFLGIGAGLLWITLLINADYVIRCGNELPPAGLGDSFSAACSLRAAKRFAREGSTADWGLAHTSYGNRFPGVGHTAAAATSRASRARSEAVEDRGDL